MTFEGPDETGSFWEATFPVSKRASFRWEGMFNAPLIVVPMSSQEAYLDRYAEPDKGWTDRDPGRWPVPYWDIDTGMAALLMLLTAVDASLGALFFGIFDVPAFRAAFGIPVAYTPIGAIAIGHPAPDEPSPSLKRGRRPLDEVLHRARW